MTKDEELAENFKQCFLKYEKTCEAYNQLLKEKRKLERQLEAVIVEDAPRFTM